MRFSSEYNGKGAIFLKLQRKRSDFYQSSAEKHDFSKSIAEKIRNSSNILGKLRISSKDRRKKAGIFSKSRREDFLLKCGGKVISFVKELRKTQILLKSHQKSTNFV